MESKIQTSESHDDIECPHTLSSFIANAPLEGDFYRQIRADIAECDRLGKSISAEIIDPDAFFTLEVQGGTWRHRIENFQRALEAFAPAEKLLDHTSGLDISDDLEEQYLELQAQIETFCENVSKYKYRISRIIRLPLYVHCLALSQRRPVLERMSNLCIRDANLPDIPSVGVNDRAVDKDTLFKHLTDLRRVDSVVKEWMFTARIVKSPIAIKTFGWTIDQEKLFNETGRWHSERQISKSSKEIQETIEEVTKQLEELQGNLEQKFGEESGFWEALDDTTTRKYELEEALDQANKQIEKKYEALEKADKQAQVTLKQAAMQAEELKALKRVLGVAYYLIVLLTSLVLLDRLV